MARIEKTIELNVPVSTAYNQWTQFETFPQFMSSVREVRQLDDTHLFWRAEVGGKEIEWEAEISEQVPEQVIAWRSTGNQRISGEVRFEKMGDQQTRVHVVMEQGNLKAAGAGEFHERVESDLQSFKSFLESQGQETGAWRGEVHQGKKQEQGQSSQGAQSSGGSQSSESQRASQSSSQASEQMKKAMDQGSESAQRMGQQFAERAAGGLRQAQQGQERSIEALSELTRQAEQMARSNVAHLQHAAQSFQQSAAQAASAAMRPFSSALAMSSRPWFSTMFHAFEEPFSAMRRLTEEMDREIESMMMRTMRMASGELGVGGAVWAPSVDVLQQNGSLVVRADLPGIDSQDVDISIQDGQLVIEGERRQQTSSNQGGVQRAECSYGRFQRVVPIPGSHNADAASASMNNGVLEIIVPANKPHANRRIEVEVGGSQSSQSSQPSQSSQSSQGQSGSAATPISSRSRTSV